ncbi:major royal jelly protein 2-like [Copidosoma floridanum]|uniref:major royal jelly protein 2-like n=1 Tax=Copidosoma floridanum TaxID=29053 RepID=UPI0006C99E1B|nr:major royal jelly protein 2-like [Copidosoma floridanum]
MDVDVDRAGRVFMSFYQYPGVPATVGVVTNKTGPWGPLIKPYPDWLWFKSDDCSKIQSVYRIAIDKCNRLWILETGYSEVTEEATNCSAKIIVFDLNTDKHIRTINIPNDVARTKDGEVTLATPIIETEGPHCEHTTVYAANVFGKLIILKGKDVWSLEHQSFQPSPNNTPSGILSLAISPKSFHENTKYLFYRPLTSTSLFFARTDELKFSMKDNHVNFFGAVDALPGQAAAMAFASQGTLFFGLINDDAIGCYNQFRELNKTNFGLVAKDKKRLSYINGVKVIKPSLAHPQEELWVLSNQWRTTTSDTFMKNNSIKFRVLKGTVRNLVKNTICDLPHK